MNKQSFANGGAQSPDSPYTMVNYELPFPPQEYNERYRRVLSAMALKGLDI